MVSRRGRLLGETRLGDVAICDLVYQEGSILDEHRHEQSYLSLVVEGEYTELRDDGPRRCGPGTAILHAPGEIHADVFLAQGRCLNFELTDGGMFPEEAILKAALLVQPAHQPAIRAALQARPDDLGANAPEWLARVTQEFAWIDAVPLNEASRLAGVHPTHFTRAFRKHTGTTPGEYRRRERVRAASKMLLGSSKGLRYVAQDCGFYDQSHLTNVFRETTGISPQLYRRAFAR